jgi:hypothetical protein
VADPILVRFRQESWIFDREIGLSPAQISHLLTRTCASEGYERNLDFVEEQCFEIFGKRVQIWRVPNAFSVFSVALVPSAERP